jgi:translation elongation factor EF-1alpha
VTAIAARAEEQHAGVIDEVSQFYAQHSGLIKTLGGAALAIALAKMKENATRGERFPSPACYTPAAWACWSAW